MARGWGEARDVQGLVGIDVADAGDDGLVEQACLDGLIGVAEGAGEIRRAEGVVQRFRAEAFGLAEDPASELSRVHEDASGGTEPEDNGGVGWQSPVGVVEEDAARHAEVNVHPSLAAVGVVELQDEVLPAPKDGVERGPDERASEVGLVGGARDARLEHLDGGNAKAGKPS
jgi:hypothetical protein